MKSYQRMIERLVKILTEDNLPYRDSIIIGDNSSGKSDVLQKIILADEKGKYYLLASE